MLAERKCECLHAGIEELDLERAIFHASLLANQLVEAIFLYCAISLGVHVNSAVGPGRFSIERHAETDGLAVVAGAQDEVQIARVESGR